ncbi:MAG: hypothetical protein AB8I08_10465 [Sandaracinaceae bacterium]
MSAIVRGVLGVLVLALLGSCANDELTEIVVETGTDFEPGLIDGCAPSQTEMFGLSDAIEVQLGRDFGCVLRRAGGLGLGNRRVGSLFCWGSNDEGQLGSAGPSGMPRQVVFSTSPPGSPGPPG